MLKGHSVIELTDVNTGEVERYEDDNIVTNGLQYYSRYHSIPASVWLNLFSGIRVFDSQLEENVETSFAPLTVGTVGYAALDADTKDPKRGIFNQSESGALDDLSGVKLVWDFAQSQVNGTIACIGITPNEYLKLDSGSSTSPGLPVNIEYRYVQGITVDGVAGDDIVDYDFARGVATTFSSYKTQGKIRISKLYARFFYHSVVEGSPFYKVLEDVYIEIANDFSTCITEANFIGGDANYYYFVALKSINATTKPFKSIFLLIKIAKLDFSMSTSEFNFCEEAYPEEFFPNSSNSLCTSFFMGDHIYLANNSTRHYYKFKMSDLSFVKRIENELLYNVILYKSYILSRNDGVLFDGVSMDINDNIHSDIWLKSGKFSTATSYYNRKHFLPVLDGKYALIMINSGKIEMYEAAMLFTVNNLSSPVTKTADKTMKITYILKEVYPETAP